jgi:ribosome production factor 1
MRNPSKIKNKVKRTAMYEKYKQVKKSTKKQLKTERLKSVSELGEKVVKAVPRTIENTRKADETTVLNGDVEVIGDENDDEFHEYYSNVKRPKIMITTRPKCSRKLYPFIGDLMQMVPNAFYYPRESNTVEQMMQSANEKEFTHLIILSEKQKECDGLMIIHLPIGPTAFFRLSSFQAGATIPNHGKPTSHIPEIILNNFTTRLGRRVGRFLGSLFPHVPDFEGRQVVTFHNQRDFIFLRHHRYIYRKETEQTRARLQELGPRFTLKLKWLQEGTFDSKFGEYEWMQTSTRFKKVSKESQAKTIGSQRRFYL